MSDLIARLRNLRAKAETINATLVDDLMPFFGREKPVFRRLPNSNEFGNVTTTCSCLMSLATTGKLIAIFKQIKGAKSDAEARSQITDVFEHAVAAPWMSSGLEDLNPFSSLIVLRTAALLTQSHEKPLERSAMELIHPKYVRDTDGTIIKEGSQKTLQNIATDIINRAPDSFSVGGYPSTPALAYWFVDAVERLPLALEGRVWEQITLWASGEFARQLSLVASEHAAMKDPVAMAAAASLSTRLRRLLAREDLVSSDKRDELMRALPTKIEVEQAILKAFQSQHKSGIWPKYFPLFNYGKGEAGSNYFFSFELLEVILGEYEKSDLLENQIVLDGIERALSWCESNRLEYKDGDENYKGWNSGGQITTLREGKPESWPTAVVHMFLFKLCFDLSDLIKKHVLLKYGANPDMVAKGSDRWDEVLDSPVIFPDENINVKPLIQRELLDINYEHHGSHKMTNRHSALLFGAPGTAKTSLVRAIASKIEWPLIEINPSDFLGKGLENIYAQVDDIFRDLNDVWGAVIFFDEMDALAKRRGASLDVTRELLTTSLLPKLSKLHNDARVLFFMATNHQKDFDPAIKRPGRFDLLLCIVPPDWHEKLANLESFWTGEKQNGDVDFVRNKLQDLVASNKNIVEALNEFTFDDFKSLLEQIRKPGSMRAAFETIAEAAFNSKVKEWQETYITLNLKETKRRAEFEQDVRASRIQ